IDTISVLVDEVGVVIGAGAEGKLDQRADADRTQGVWRKILRGVNDAMDGVISPLNVAAEYVDRIAKGNTPPKITEEYKGDFNEIKNNLNECIDTISVLVDEVGVVIGAGAEGKLDQRADADRTQGVWRKILRGVNDAMDGVISPLNVAAGYIERIAGGDIPPQITEEYKGDFNEIKNNLNTCIDVMNGLLKETENLIGAVGEGRLDTRGNAEAFTGGWGRLVGGMNEMVEAVAKPLKMAAEYVDLIAKGDKPPYITEEYKGDFNLIKNSLNTLIDTLSGLLKETEGLIAAISEGRLDARGNTAALSGDWGRLVGGMNEMMEAVAKPVDELVAVMGRMAVNDYATNMTGDYAGAWNDLKDSTNNVYGRFVMIREVVDNVSRGSLIDLDGLRKLGRRSENDELIPSFIRMMEAIQGLVEDANMLAAAAVEGKLDTRADAGRHSGDFNKVIDGVNKTLDAVIGPLNVAAEYIDRISKGDIPPKINETYRGDFNEIKNNLNTCIDSVNGLVQEVDGLIIAVGEGNLEARGNAAAFAGDWGKLVSGMNGLMAAVAEPVEELMAVLRQIAVNDLSNKMEKDYSGAWNDLKKATNEVCQRLNDTQRAVVKISNGDLTEYEYFKKAGRRSEKDELIPGFIQMHEAIIKLVEDADMLAGMAVEGKLDTRADISQHAGEYRRVIEGVNKMMDAVVNPIHEAADCLKAMAEGHLDVRVTGIYQGDHAIIKNALNTTLEALNEIIKKEAVRCLQEVARGNLDVEITGNYKGDYAIIKDALNTTINDLNETLAQVSIAIEQVNTGAQQVSDSSQALSQGAAESAGTMAGITSSMQQMNVQTKQNAENATQANQLAAQARANAERGNEQMAQMVNAMSDINESASNISKIIKAIDEIAFQTNLLALNAAVEAARAGKHGKGFTVVAEEVRNLAQRSAKAAKETAEMIEGSIKKTEIGTKIAEDTSRALGEIVTGSAKVTDLISEIASASKEQAQGIAQINEGLGQVDQVTQQNSASSEELAAASEEMSSQSEMVRQMLAGFKLKRQVVGSAAAGQLYMGQQQQAWEKPGRATQRMAAAASDRGRVKPQDVISLDDVDYGKF
ncbi:MAG: methyl-accepting chemotaxis protein, partial [Desulfotomaculaceae bacterium]|nr:methyl-accepting chemotaxis protein [Desulfotomaculaceae bacterium]